METYYFNIRANGIFADGFVDRDGAPVRDTFVYQLRAKMMGSAARSWSAAQNAQLAAGLSSAQMNAIMSPVDHPHVRVEYDTSFYGGEYAGQGRYSYVPQALVDISDGDVAAAFETMTRIDAVHVVSYTSDERFDADGTPQHDLESAGERA